MSACQVCGRRQHVTRAGGVVFHHVRGAPCPGAGFPPIEFADGRLREMVKDAEEKERELLSELAALYERRANWIDPGLVTRLRAASDLSSKLRRRLNRHLRWPDRFAREMERQGWGTPPPDYLLAP